MISQDILVAAGFCLKSGLLILSKQTKSLFSLHSLRLTLTTSVTVALSLTIIMSGSDLICTIFEVVIKGCDFKC